MVAYLNEYENICGAVQAAIADSEVAYGIHSANVIGDFHVYWPFIEDHRTKFSDDEIWVEFEKTCREWEARANREAASDQRQLLLPVIRQLELPVPAGFSV